MNYHQMETEVRVLSVEESGSKSNKSMKLSFQLTSGKRMELKHVSQRVNDKMETVTVNIRVNCVCTKGSKYFTNLATRTLNMVGNLKNM